MLDRIKYAGALIVRAWSDEDGLRRALQERIDADGACAFWPRAQALRLFPDTRGFVAAMTRVGDGLIGARTWIEAGDYGNGVHLYAVVPAHRAAPTLRDGPNRWDEASARRVADALGWPVIEDERSSHAAFESFDERDIADFRLLTRYDGHLAMAYIEYRLGFAPTLHALKSYCSAVVEQGVEVAQWRAAMDRAGFALERSPPRRSVADAADEA